MHAGRVEGRVEEARALVQKQIARRFGTLPDWVSERTNQLGLELTEDLALRLLDARSLEDLFEADPVLTPPR